MRTAAEHKLTIASCYVAIPHMYLREVRRATFVEHESRALEPDDIGRMGPVVRLKYAMTSKIQNYPAGVCETTKALPTISIRESPGIHSTAMQARDGALPGLKYVL